MVKQVEPSKVASALMAKQIEPSKVASAFGGVRTKENNGIRRVHAFGNCWLFRDKRLIVLETLNPTLLQ
jgi:hypothetical protein